MFTKFILPLLALLGFSFSVFSVVNSNKPLPVAPPAATPAQAPFQNFLAGAGIIEAESRNINLGTPLPGIVSKLLVKVGDSVKIGSPLFYIDDREAQANMAVKQADIEKAKAAVVEAEASLRDSQTLYNLAASITDRRAISTEELDKRKNAVLIAKAHVASAKAGILQAQAAVTAAQTTLDRLVVKAPIDGEILQINIRPGEFAQAGTVVTPLITMGKMDALRIRVDIDENDAWRFNKTSKAVAFLRGNRDFSTDLTLAYVEPFVVPKKSLTGDSTERVDTRVLQALYQFDRSKLNAYVGQQMDVYIEAAAITQAPVATTDPGKPQ
jgi:RND family efflux transporter MFP subunit